MGVEIRIENLDKVAARLAALDERFSQPARPLFEVLGEEWTSKFRDNIVAQHQVGGEPFAALAPKTQRLRAWRGFPAERPILERTGDLRQSIQVLSMTDDELVVGTRHRTAGVLQHGGVFDDPRDVPGQREVPPRPFVGLTALMVEDTLAMVRAHFLGEEGAAGG